MIERIALIDDDHVCNFINEELFKEHGFKGEIHTYLDAIDALKHLLRPEEKPDMILLDLNMPTMDGFDFLEVYLHSNPRNFKGVTIIALTSSENKRDMDKLAEYGITRIINKPLTDDKIDEMLHL